MTYKFLDQEYIEVMQNQEKIACISFLVECWIHYAVHVQKELGADQKIVDYIKKGARTHSQIVKFHCYSLIFKLLDFLAGNRNPTAAMIYKTIIFFLIENSADQDLRELILRNFIVIIQKYSQIPIEILLEPYIKQIHLSHDNNTQFLNVFDFEFLHVATTHPNIQLKLGILMADLMSKIYLNHHVWSRSIIGPLQNLIQKFQGHEAFQELVINLCVFCLQFLLESMKSDTARKKQPKPTKTKKTLPTQ